MLILYVYNVTCSNEPCYGSWKRLNNEVDSIPRNSTSLSAVLNVEESSNAILICNSSRGRIIFEQRADPCTGDELKLVRSGIGLSRQNETNPALLIRRAKLPISSLIVIREDCKDFRARLMDIALPNCLSAMAVRKLLTSIPLIPPLILLALRYLLAIRSGPYRFLAPLT